jgi:hypothetical protein
MKHYVLFPVLMLTCMLGACATEPALYQTTMAPQPAPETWHAPVMKLEVPRPLPATSNPAPREAAVTPMHYYAWATKATPEELEAERLRLSSRRYPADPVIDTVHLGMLLSVSAIASRDTELEAQALLESVNDPAYATLEGRDYAIFADFLLNHLEQREHLREATTSVVASREKNESLERTNQDLKKTIEALTSIEEQLIEREQEQEQEQEPQQVQQEQAPQQELQ